MLATFLAAHAMKERMSRQMLARSDVHGIGVGYHDPRNPKKGAAVIIYITSFSPTMIRISSTMAMRVKGKAVIVPVRFVKSGKMQAYVDYKKRIRPIPAGYSVGTTGGSGTVGLIVTNVPKANQRYIFSNNHVLNPTNSSSFTEILQPGGADNGRLGRDTVGRLYRYVKLQKNKINRVDIALAIPRANCLLSPRYATIGVLPGYVTTYRVGERFKKVGRTSGLVNGVVDSINTDIQIDYGDSIGMLNFKNQTVIKGRKPLSLPGDSGSVWLRKADHYAAAVNFAGSSNGRISVAFPVNWAMQIFGTQIARPDGSGCIKKVYTDKSPGAYARQLTARELASLEIHTARSKKRKRT
ncbi:hypothetical protein PMSD_26340 [Paenibacillus macquariensis subsp. defensor]|nr:hypothetical protein PMSD_26340 [Paenibacillus macquariensis subsp. defensor]